MSKKGMSHIEVIMSFMLFIGAVILIFYLFDLPRYTVLNSAELKETFSYFESNISSELIEVGIENSATGIFGANLGFNLIGLDANVSAKNALGQKLTSDIDTTSNTICLNNNAGSTLDKFTFVIISNAIENSNENSCPDSPLLYNVGSFNKRIVVSEEAVLIFNGTYYNQYNLAKNAIKIPRNREFEFKVVFSDGKVASGSRTFVPSNSEIAAYNKREEILMKNGDIEYADIQLRIW